MNRILLSIDIPRLKKIPLNQINYNIQGLSTKNLYNLWDELDSSMSDYRNIIKNEETSSSIKIKIARDWLDNEIIKYAIISLLDINDIRAHKPITNHKKWIAEHGFNEALIDEYKSTKYRLHVDEIDTPDGYNYYVEDELVQRLLSDANIPQDKKSGDTNSNLKLPVVKDWTKLTLTIDKEDNQVKIEYGKKDWSCFSIKELSFSDKRRTDMAPKDYWTNIIVKLAETNDGLTGTDDDAIYKANKILKELFNNSSSPLQTISSKLHSKFNISLLK